MSFRGPVAVGEIAQAIVRGFRNQLPADAVIPEPQPREPDVRVVAETRDERRNWWLNLLLQHMTREARPPRHAREHFTGRGLLPLTLKDVGEVEFSHIGGYEVRQACRALYAPGGFVALWSNTWGTGKSTFAYWLLMRHLRVLAEELADDRDATCNADGVAKAPLPHLAWTTWRRAIGVIKSQMGRPAGEQVLSRLRRADLLILDDIGQQTPWEHSVLVDLLADRYGDLRKTVLVATDIRAKEDLQDSLGSRVLSMIQERGALVQVGGEGFRDSRESALVAADSVPF